MPPIPSNQLAAFFHVSCASSPSISGLSLSLALSQPLRAVRYDARTFPPPQLVHLRLHFAHSPLLPANRAFDLRFTSGDFGVVLLLNAPTFSHSYTLQNSLVPSPRVHFISSQGPPEFFWSIHYLTVAGVSFANQDETAPVIRTLVHLLTFLARSTLSPFSNTCLRWNVRHPPAVPTRISCTPGPWPDLA